MTIETYWLVTPLALSVVTGFGCLALWLTQPRPPNRSQSRAIEAEATAEAFHEGISEFIVSIR